jgi:ATP-dependent exoDNAse (exonuclease V) alpha subunit
MQVVRRQQVDWQRQASERLNDGRISEGILPYFEKGHLHFLNGKEDVHASLVNAYLKGLKAHPEVSSIVLAYRKQEVRDLNLKICEGLKMEGLLKDEVMLEGQGFAVGDRIRFMENDHRGRRAKNTHDSFLKSLKEVFSPVLLGGARMEHWERCWRCVKSASKRISIMDGR